MKVWIRAAFGLLLGLLLGSSAYADTFITHTFIKNFLEKTLSATFQKEVNIESVEGSLLGQAILKGITIAQGPSLDQDGSLLRIKELDIAFNLSKTILNGGNLVPYISAIKIIQPHIDLIRMPNGKFKVFEKYTPPAVRKRTELAGTIEIVQGEVVWIDQKCFGSGLPDTPTVIKVNNLRGLADFGGDQNWNYHFEANLPQRSTSVALKIRGQQAHLSADFNCVIQALGLPLNEWHRYIMPDAKLDIQKGLADATLTLSNNPPGSEKKVKIVIEANFRQTDLTLGKIPKPLVAARGSVYLDADGVQFNDISGSYEGQAFKFKASLRPFKKGVINGQLNMVGADVAAILGSLPSINVSGLSGLMDVNADFEGPMNDLVINAQCPLRTLQWYGVSIDAAQAKCRYQGATQLFATQITGQTLGGQMDTQLNLLFTPEATELNGSLSVLGASQLPKVAPENLQGTYNFLADISGTTRLLMLKSRLDAEWLSVFNQRLQGFSGSMVRTPEGWSWMPEQLVLNDTAVDVALDWPRDQAMHLQLAAKALPLMDLPLAGNRLSMMADLKSELRLQKNTETCEYAYSGDIVLDAHDATVNDTDIKRAFVDVSWQNGDIEINRLDVERPSENLRVYGSIVDKKITSIWLSAQHFDLGLLKGFEAYFPDWYRHSEGFLSAEIYVRRQVSDTHAVVATGALQKFQDIAAYEATGSVTLEKASLSEQAIDLLQGRFLLQHGRLIFDPLNVTVRSSHLALAGTVGLDGVAELTLEPQSYIDFSDFVTFTRPLGDIVGVGQVDGMFKGSLTDPELTFNADFTQVGWGQVLLQNVKTRLSFKDNILRLDPLEVNVAGDHLETQGWVNCQTLMRPKGLKKLPQDYDMHLSFAHADLARLRSLFGDISAELSRAHGVDAESRSVLSDTDAAGDPNAGVSNKTMAGNLIYSLRADQETALSDFISLQYTLDLLRHPKGLQFGSEMQGLMNGDVRLKSGFQLEGRLGLINFSMGALQADKMAIDIQSAEHGAWQASVDLQHLQVGASSLDQINLLGLYDPAGWVTIKSSQLALGKKTYADFLTGHFPAGVFWSKLPETSTIDINLQLPDDAIGILAVAFPSVQSISNQGLVGLTLTGSVADPLINLTQADFKRLTVLFTKGSYLSSPLQVSELDVQLEDNQLTVNAVRALWQGPETGDKPNFIRASGTAQIHIPPLGHASALTVDVAMNMESSEWNIDLPSVFTGKLRLDDFALSHAIVLPLSNQRRAEWKELLRQGNEASMVLSGNVHLLGGVWTLPNFGGNKKMRAPLHLNLALHLDSDLRMVGQLIGGDNIVSALISDLDLEINPSTTPFYLGGTLNHFRPSGKLKIYQGQMAMLSHVFEVQSQDQQKLFFADDINKLLDNSIVFDVGVLDATSAEDNLRSSLIPNLNLVAMTKIDAATVSQNLGETAVVSGQDRYLLVRVDGSLTDASNIVFEQYEKSAERYKGVADPVALQAKEDRKNINNLLALINPGNYYAELFSEIQKEGIQGQHTRTLMADITQKQVNNLFQSVLRPVERDLARSIGLYDIKLDYNLGNDVNQFLGLPGSQSTDTTQTGTGSTSTAQKILGIDVVQNLVSDRLFLTLKTEIQKQQDNSLTSLQLSEYLVTYYFTSWLTFNYSNKQFNPQTPLQGSASVEASLAF